MKKAFIFLLIFLLVGCSNESKIEDETIEEQEKEIIPIKTKEQEIAELVESLSGYGKLSIEQEFGMLTIYKSPSWKTETINKTESDSCKRIVLNEKDYGFLECLTKVEDNPNYKITESDYKEWISGYEKNGQIYVDKIVYDDGSIALISDQTYENYHYRNYQYVSNGIIHRIGFFTFDRDLTNSEREYAYNYFQTISITEK